jgi:hypothetical protein
MPNPRLNDPVIFAIREDWKRYLLTAPEGQANTRLIAAAPELLESGRAVLASIDSGIGNDFGALHRLRVAIAKAEGGQ